MGKLQRLLSLNWFHFIYYNFLCKNITRDKRKFILPRWGTRIELHKNARIILHAHLCLNENKYPYSKAECYLRLRSGAVMTVTGNVNLMYGGTVEIHKNAKMEIGSCSIQTGAAIICAYKMKIGQGCLFSRMCYVSDSDHHRIMDEQGETVNYPRETVIGDHVWISVKATVMKGSKIKEGSVVSANAVAGGRIHEHRLVMAEPARAFSDIYWSEEGFGDRQ